MNALARFALAALLVALALSGCALTPHKAQAPAPAAKPEGARLSTAEVIRIARQTAELHGIDLGKYKEPEAHYDHTSRDGSWFVFFDGRVPMPGNHFGVMVDDRTGEAQLHRGR